MVPRNDRQLLAKHLSQTELSFKSQRRCDISSGGFRKAAMPIYLLETMRLSVSARHSSCGCCVVRLEQCIQADVTG
jgi:hypothetical protein